MLKYMNMYLYLVWAESCNLILNHFLMSNTSQFPTKLFVFWRIISHITMPFLENTNFFPIHEYSTNEHNETLQTHLKITSQNITFHAEHKRKSNFPFEKA